MKIMPGTYRHFKGFLCEVVGVARQSETGDELVMYSHDNQLWARPLTMFLETVEKDGQSMPRFTYLGREKLVRDGIPEIISAEAVSEQGTAEVRTASPDEYKVLIKAKLREEAEEFAAKPSAEELADVLEVAAAAGEAFGITNEEIERVMMSKRAERGGFEKGYVLKL